MARTSRKNVSQAVRDPIEPIYNTALYVRLSAEDSHTNNKEVIEVQKHMVQQFVNSQQDMLIYETYCDNGYTGTNFHRPSFERMMEDVKSRRVNCIVVKDLSRFGRNYIETGYFLENIFPFLGVRFIAINDNYDTLHNVNGEDMVVSMKNLVNSIYAKDISKKISTVFHEKQKKGQYIAGVMPYGFAKNPDNINQLIINPETAKNVALIFKMRLEGNGYCRITRTLNEQKILTPVMYNYLSGKYRKTAVSKNAQIWNMQSVKRILSNMCYAGHIEGHKRHQSLYEGVGERVTAKNERIIIYHTHEPIVSQNDFDKVQNINEITRQKYANQEGKYPLTENIFKGIIYCGDCDIRMMRSKNVTKKGAIYYTFKCRTRRQNGFTDTSCSLKMVGESELIDLILQSIRVYAKLSITLSEKLTKKQKTKKHANEEQRLQKKTHKLQQDIDKLILKKTVIFEGFADSKLDFQEFTAMKVEYEQEIKLIQQQQKTLIEEQKRIISNKNKWLEAFINHQDTTVLTRGIVTELVEKISISEYNTVTIIWKYRDELSKLTAYLGVQGT